MKDEWQVRLVSLQIEFVRDSLHVALNIRDPHFHFTLLVRIQRGGFY